MSWAGRRQFIYSFGFLIFVLGVLVLLFYPIFYKSPTCSDGKKNGKESGVDCGGQCIQYCIDQVSAPSILWSRIFPISGSKYNLVAYIENQNIDAAVADINYEFRVYDAEGKLIGRKEGHTFIPPNQRFGIFEPHFDAGKSIPKNTVFQFTSKPVWVKKSAITQALPIRVDRITYSEDDDSPVLQARIRNESIFDAPGFDIITILYDASQNAIGVSKTHLDGLGKNQSLPIIFTWPTKFNEVPVVKDIIPQINPFDVRF